MSFTAADVPDQSGKCFIVTGANTGIGFDYDSHGPESAIGMERSFEPWNRVHLLPTVLPTLDGVVAKLTAGASVSANSSRGCPHGS